MDQELTFNTATRLNAEHICHVKIIASYDFSERIVKVMSSVGSYESSEDDRSEHSHSVAFSQDLLSTSSLELEDIQEAISGVKRTILETEVSSQARRELVEKLIRLRIKKECLEERKMLEVAGEEEHEGHVMVPCNNISPTKGVLYCGECGGTLWYLLQTVYICKVLSLLSLSRDLSSVFPPSSALYWSITNVFRQSRGSVLDCS